ncbi:MAG: hypothetical protein JO339_28525, partial [Alphaproteobacteria bacterium]|nr:hypothetical protein [Alphaproteobacteria bacterium]
MIAARGYAVHPADWMPAARDDWVPDLYAPWLEWIRAGTLSAPTPSAFDLDTYDQWSWMERYAALARLRGDDPATARAIIAAKISSEPAERRLKLIELLTQNLSQDDRELLDALASDRSDRVQALVRALSARLGQLSDTDAAASELADMVEVARVGVLRRRNQLVIKGLKTAAQIARRRELFKLVTWPS